MWTRDELILAVKLYCKLPFGKLDKNTKEAKTLAVLLDRKSNSVALKPVNFSSLDPSLQASGIKGMGNASKLDKQVWDEFYDNWDTALIESEEMLARATHTTIERMNDAEEVDLLQDGKEKEKERLIKVRLNQNIFRKIILAIYNNACSITGIDTTELLVASHIVPWSKDERNRLNPMKGLWPNALHDKAFDVGLIKIAADNYCLHISPGLKRKNSPAYINQCFLQIDGQQIKLPDKFLPSKKFLKQHNDCFKI